MVPENYIDASKASTPRSRFRFVRLTIYNKDINSPTHSRPYESLLCDQLAMPLARVYCYLSKNKHRASSSSLSIFAPILAAASNSPSVVRRARTWRLAHLLGGSPGTWQRDENLDRTSPLRFLSRKFFGLQSCRTNLGPRPAARS